MKGPTTFVAVRDVVFLTLGVAGIAFQQITGQVEPILLGVYLTLLGVPGLSNGLWLLKQIGEPQSSAPPVPPLPGDSQPGSEQ